MLLTTTQKVAISISTLLVVLVFGLIFKSCNYKKSFPRFRNGDMVVHTLSEKEGQVIDNRYRYNRKSSCWKVKVRIKKDPAIKESSLALKIGKMLDEVAPSIYDEFELEKQ